MIAVLSLNPCLDKSAEADSFSPSTPLRLRSVRRDLAGKGVNVAVMLHHLGKDVVLCGFDFQAGNLPVSAFAKAHGISCRLTPVDGELRVNLKIHLRSTGQTLEISETGAQVSPEQAQKALEDFIDTARQSEFAVLSGSAPPGVDPKAYRAAGQKLKEAGIPFAVDADGDLLFYALQAQPDCIKPNQDEFIRLYARLYPKENALPVSLPAEEYLPYVKKVLRDTGCKKICLSLGAQGALLTDGREAALCSAPPVSVQATQGAGDALLSGVVKALCEGQTMEYALRLGTAASGATVMRSGSRMGERKAAEDLLHLLRCRVLPLP